MLRQWIQDHPRESAPGLIRLNKNELNTPPRQAVMISTLERVQVFRYQVTTHHMAWFLVLRNGSYMLVSPRKGSSGGYVAWLGTNLGFTSSAIAYRISAPQTTPLADCVQNIDGSRGDSGLVDVEPDLVGTNDDEERYSTSSTDFDNTSDEDFQPGIPIVLSRYHCITERKGKRAHKRATRRKAEEQSKEPLPPHRRSHDVRGPPRPKVHRQMKRPSLPPFQPKLEPERESSPTRRPEPSLPSEHHISHSRRPLKVLPTVEPESSPIVNRERSLTDEELEEAPSPTKEAAEDRTNISHPSEDDGDADASPFILVRAGSWARSRVPFPPC